MKKIIFSILAVFVFAIAAFAAQTTAVYAATTEATLTPADRAEMNLTLKNLESKLLEMQKLALAQKQLAGVDPKQAATLKTALDTLQGLLAETQSRLDAKKPFTNKDEVNGSLSKIKGNLTGINSTLAALGVPIGSERVAAGKQQSQLSPIVAAQPQSEAGKKTASKINPGINQNPGAPTVSAISKESKPEIAQVERAFNYKRFGWSLIGTIAVIAAFAVLFLRKSGRKEEMSVEKAPSPIIQPTVQQPVIEASGYVSEKQI